MNYYERHLGDYAKDTAHLSMLEHGAYSLLLDRYYGTEAGIPAAQAHRVARARSKEEKQAVDDVLTEFFSLADGVWINQRAEEEIAKAHVKINAAKENGKKGGRPKKQVPGSETETQDKPSGLFASGEENNGKQEISKTKRSSAPQQKNIGNSETEGGKHNEIKGSEKPTGFSLGSETETQEKAHQVPDTSLLNTSTQVALTTELPDEPSAATENATRVGSLCKQLRLIGIDAAPHLPAWPDLLERFTDEQIITVAQIAKERKPNERIHLNYLVPILNEPPKAPANGAKRKPAPENFDNRDYGQGGRL